MTIECLTRGKRSANRLNTICRDGMPLTPTHCQSAGPAALYLFTPTTRGDFTCARSRKTR
ncbi:hypothetical protein PCAR4_60048 [Paraburkholderia caribensis]|nr:hypothetical protein PCAR4_60048 [Paraburkholderia caribensis]